MSRLFCAVAQPERRLTRLKSRPVGALLGVRDLASAGRVALLADTNVYINDLCGSLELTGEVRPLADSLLRLGVELLVLLVDRLNIHGPALCCGARPSFRVLAGSFPRLPPRSGLCREMAGHKSGA
jgi:hypothetical protein